MAKVTLTVVLDKRDDKKNSVKFFTDSETNAASNVYIPKDGVEKLGDPQKVKITIEAA